MFVSFLFDIAFVISSRCVSKIFLTDIFTVYFFLGLSGDRREDGRGVAAQFMSVLVSAAICPALFLRVVSENTGVHSTQARHCQGLSVTACLSSSTFIAVNNAFIVLTVVLFLG